MQGRQSFSPPLQRPRRYLYELDLVRVVTFACVIAVHVISHTATNDVPSYALLTLVHFTREVFFALSAFVLVYTSLDRRGSSLWAFTRRRFLLVLIPYVAWSAIYVALGYSESPGGSALEVLGRFGWVLLTGTAWYHLYFLLVTLQIYLLLPLILALVKKTRRHHMSLLVASGLVQLVLTALYFYDPAGIGWLNSAKTSLVISYQFFILLGAVAADHAEGLLASVRRHRRFIGWAMLPVAALTVGYFLVSLAFGDSATTAATALQPILMVWSTAASAGLLALGTVWADRRRPGALNAVLRVGSDRSFGIFLAHPLVLAALLWAGNGWFQKQLTSPWPLAVVIYLLTVIGTVVIAELARRSPLSLVLTGRPFRPTVFWLLPSRGQSEQRHSAAS